MSRHPLLDQVAHIAAGAIAVAPMLFWQNPLTGAWASFCIGAAREFTEWQLNPQHGPSPFSGHGAITSRGSLIDLRSWAAIGFVLGTIAWLT